MVEDGLTSDDSWQSIRALDEEFLSRYSLSSDEMNIVRNKPTPEKFASVGLPPLLAMWGSFMCNPEFERMMSAGEYFAAAMDE
ncbi:hypothetical protein [Mycolicibacterium holsaticum]|uniref:Extradiol ring-cleavage dioxygenase LigAB LigA subunit domain-containing protein n=1 Tax=Mycolicibacterium holsaticum TaxID=152142 RepID=A0A1E3R2U1_9MYCO|nr:hypothetical protein [Mycolicibacterium holsaticum]ODQ84203.1 hypothetical protein BHQ17_27940 [Mycolicibacterium holsaticum]